MKKEPFLEEDEKEIAAAGSHSVFHVLQAAPELITEVACVSCTEEEGRVSNRHRESMQKGHRLACSAPCSDRCRKRWNRQTDRRRARGDRLSAGKHGTLFIRPWCRGQWSIMSAQAKEQRVSRWYFGGTASAGAAMCTHPLDLLKVHLQTQQHGQLGIVDMTMKIVRSDGIRGLYNGISASLLRQDADVLHVFQMTYSLTRFGMYEQLKKQFPGDSTIPFYQKAAMAGISGACGGFIGTPGDMVNVRMQNDMKLPPAERRNYKHAFDGLFRVMRDEGVTRLFNGAAMATSRAVFMTIGQLSFYDQIKQVAISTGYFKDTPTTHFGSSFAAASIATVLTQPLDVMKTRMMNAKPGQFNGILSCFVYTAKLGPTGFFKGFIPAWVRLAPQTILTFIFLEQLRLNFGYFRTPVAK
uniref:Mitochondrial dicarboxylate carrier n=1 Tax=Setaria digitata TaxID=48799 RepID=A0A915Q634_9BILA